MNARTHAELVRDFAKMLKERFGRVGRFLGSSLLLLFYLLILFLVLIAGQNMFSGIFRGIVISPADFRTLSFWGVILIVLPTLVGLAYFTLTRGHMVLRESKARLDESKSLLAEAAQREERATATFEQSRELLKEARDIQEETDTNLAQARKLLAKAQHSSQERSNTPASQLDCSRNASFSGVNTMGLR